MIRITHSTFRQGVPIDEVFIGSCMTNIGHFRTTGDLLENFP